MKKFLAMILSLALIFSFAACISSDEGSSVSESADVSFDSNVSSALVKDPEDKKETPEKTEISSNILVVYFSRTGEQYGVGIIEKGNTAIAAEMIVEATGADSFEILPKEDYYPTTYDELIDIAKQEQNDNARPEIKDEPDDLSSYDTIFIGAPVWWGDWPMIMYTFFEEHESELAGKKLVPFSTHAGSGLSGFDIKLGTACPASEILEGIGITGSEAQNNPESVREQVNDWLSELGYYNNSQ